MEGLMTCPLVSPKESSFPISSTSSMYYVQKRQLHTFFGTWLWLTIHCFMLNQNCDWKLLWFE
jgi:hypothetical protein